VNVKSTIRKILFILFWVSIGGGMLTLLIAAIGKKNRELCSDYTVHIKSDKESLFIDEKEITQLLKAAVGSDFRGKKVTEIDLGRLEQLLKDNIWIRNAEMWFDNGNLLHIEVWEREPVARIFTTAGNTFFIDSSAVQLPLSEKIITNLPVFTGIPDKNIYTRKDSMLLQDVKQMAIYILHDAFWQSQVEQIHYTGEEKFEMIPLVGNHIVKIGDGKNIDSKFSRLMTFYKQVLAKTGFDAYSIVDVQYTGQVIGTKRGTEKNRIDTNLLKKNIDELLKHIQKQNDSLETTKMTIEKPAIESGSEKVSTTGLSTSGTRSANPNAMKAQSLPGKNESKPNGSKPKAVMPKKRSQ
jgi:cell division protein FtsQ